jgi:hypothetical protein
MDISPYEREVLTRTVMAEAGEGAPPNEQAAVAHVIMNRLHSGLHPGSVGGVIFEKNAFESWHNPKNDPRRFDPYGDSYQRAAHTVNGVLNGTIPDPTGGADMFQNRDVVADRIKKGLVSKNVKLAPDDALKIGPHSYYKSPELTARQDDWGMPGGKAEPEPGPTKVAAAGPGVPTAPSPPTAPDHDDWGMGEVASAKEPEKPAAEPTEFTPETHAEELQAGLEERAATMPPSEVFARGRGLGGWDPAVEQWAKQHPVLSKAIGYGPNAAGTAAATLGGAGAAVAGMPVWAKASMLGGGMLGVTQNLLPIALGEKGSHAVDSVVGLLQHLLAMRGE